MRCDTQRNFERNSGRKRHACSLCHHHVYVLPHIITVLKM